MQHSNYRLAIHKTHINHIRSDLSERNLISYIQEQTTRKLWSSLTWRNALQALLLSERCAAEEARKACSDAEARNTELVNKVEDAERKVDQLQDSVQRYINSIENMKFLELISYLRKLDV